MAFVLHLDLMSVTDTKLAQGVSAGVLQVGLGRDPGEDLLSFMFRLWFALGSILNQVSYVKSDMTTKCQHNITKTVIMTSHSLMYTEAEVSIQYILQEND